MQITTTIRQCETSSGKARREMQEFSALASGLAQLREWLSGQRIEVAAMEATA